MSVETVHSTRLSDEAEGRLRRLMRSFLALFGRRYPKLDIDAMEPHMLRDLGFLDGRDPRYEPADRR